MKFSPRRLVFFGSAFVFIVALNVGHLESSPVGEANLLPNAGFENDKQPEDWPFKADSSKSSEIVEADGKAHAGKRCFMLRPDGPREGGGFPYQSSVATIPLKMQAEQSYEISLWFRSENVVKADTPDLISMLAIYWCDSEGNYIKHENTIIDKDGVRNDWEQLLFSAQSPPGTDTAFIEISFYGAEGAFYLDDLSFSRDQSAAATK